MKKILLFICVVTSSLMFSCSNNKSTEGQESDATGTETMDEGMNSETGTMDADTSATGTGTTAGTEMSPTDGTTTTSGTGTGTTAGDATGAGSGQ